MSESERLAREEDTSCSTCRHARIQAAYSNRWLVCTLTPRRDCCDDCRQWEPHPARHLANAAHIARLEADLTRAQDSLREIVGRVERTVRLPDDSVALADVARKGLGEGE